MVVKKGGFLQRVGGMLESAATKVDNAVFKTDAVNSARKNLENPEFTEFLARTAEKGGVSVEALQSGGNDRKLGTTFERFEKVNTTIGRAKEVLTNQFKEQMGIDVMDADLQTVEIYFKDAAFEDPKTLDRLAATFEKGVKMQAEVAQRRGQLEALKDRFGRDKLALMDMRDMGGMFGNKETRAWAREEARERGYGPIRAWMFKTFSANSAIEEKISEGSSLSMEKRREAYNHISSAQSDVEKAEGKVHDKLITRMLKQSDFAVKAIEIARGKAMERIASAIDSPEQFDVKGLVEERKRLETLAQSDFAPEDGVFEEATVVGGRDQKAEHLFEMLESSVKYRVDQIMEQLVEQLADPAVNLGFSELLAQVQSVVGDLSDGTPDGNRDARIQVAERLAQRPTTGLTSSKSMMVSMVINHLSR
jgi:hypothetical protein